MKTRVVALACAALVCLTGCTADPDPEPSPSPSSVTIPAAGLRGAWTVEDTGTAFDSRPLFITSSGITVTAECGTAGLDWGAGPTAIVIDGPVLFSAGCATTDRPDLEFAGRFDWLTRAIAYERAGDGWRLTGDSGEVVATLAPFESARTSWEKEWPDSAFVRDRDAFDFPALAEGLSPVTLDALQGTWVREGTREPGMTIRANRWENNGCHGGGAVFRVDDGGFVVTHSFLMSSVQCAPADTLLRSGYGGFDGDVLVVGSDRLVRAAGS